LKGKGDWRINNFLLRVDVRESLLLTTVDEGPAAKKTPNAIGIKYNFVISFACFLKLFLVTNKYCFIGIEFDAESYDQNVEKLKNLVAKNGNKDNIVTLFKITHLGRRREINEGSYRDIYDFMKNHFPVLNEGYFVSTSNNFILSLN